jgi:hypothetical protein
MPPSCQHDRGNGRVAGLIAGLAVAGGYELLVALDAGDLGSPGYGIAAVIAGSLGGWIFGPGARSSQSDHALAIRIVGLAVTTVVIGAIVVGVQMGLAIEPASDGFRTTFDAVLAMVILALVFGVPTLGLLILPVTLAASAIWALLMVFSRPGAIKHGWTDQGTGLGPPPASPLA